MTPSDHFVADDVYNAAALLISTREIRDLVRRPAKLAYLQQVSARSAIHA